MFDISKMMNSLKSQLSANAPQILMWSGIALGLTSTGFAVYGTTKLPEKVKDHNERVEKAKESDSKEKDKAIAKEYVKTGLTLAALYAPAAIAGVGGIACVVKSNDILTKRNKSLAALATMILSGFATYRERVAEKYGKEVDQELRYGIKSEPVTVEVVDENGKKHKVKKVEKVLCAEDHAKLLSDYARIFDCGNPCWQDDVSANLHFLTIKLGNFQNLLVARGYLFLNEVYEGLGFDTTIEGQSLGWVVPRDSEEQVGDPFVDFGIIDIKKLGINPKDYYDEAFVLDFNCCDIMNGYFKPKLGGNFGSLNSALVRKDDR